MPTLSDRSLRVAILGVVPDDDPHIIADMQMEIERLTTRCGRLRSALEKIGWLDEFLDADGAMAMMNMARDAVNADEQSSRQEG